MADPACVANDRRLAVFLMDDCLEHGGELGAKYWLEFGKHLVFSTEDPAESVRLAACYGLGAAAATLGPRFNEGDAPARVVEALVKRVVAKDAYADEDAELLHDNAVNSLIRILRHQVCKAAPQCA